MTQVSFKSGLLDNLHTTGLNEGCIYITTDTHSMFVDLDGKRFRIGDFEKYKSLKELADNQKDWYKGSLALVEPEEGTNVPPILAYYNGAAWININDTTGLKTALEGKIKTVADDLATEKSARENLATLVSNNEKAIKNNQEAISGHSTKIETIENTIGDRPTGYQSTIWAAISNLIGGDGASGDSLASLNRAIIDEKDRATAAENALGTRIDTVVNEAAQTYATKQELGESAATVKSEAATDATNKADAAKAAAKNYTDTEIDSVTTLINETDRKVNILIGDDSNTTVRAISAEEVARIVANAPASYDTLKEIADWIQNDTDGAASMANDIAALKEKTTLGTDTNGKEYSTVQDYVENIQKALETLIKNTDDKLNWGTF